MVLAYCLCSFNSKLISLKYHSQQSGSSFSKRKWQVILLPSALSTQNFLSTSCYNPQIRIPVLVFLPFEMHEISRVFFISYQTTEDISLSIKGQACPIGYYPGALAALVHAIVVFEILGLMWANR